MRARLFSLFLIALASAALAQTPTPAPSTSPEPARQPLWRCDLPGGSYEVALRNVVSVSSHEYIVDGAARVTEVNVDTNGSMTVRFYYIEPVTPNAPLGVGQSALNRMQDLAKEVAGRTGQDELWQKVVKSYPATTHARTIEYRVDTQDELKKIFSSAEHAFRLGQGATLKIP